MPPTNLTVPLEEATAKISAQIAEGIKLRDKAIRTDKELDEAQSAWLVWSSYNEEMLKRMFSDESTAQEYVGHSQGGVGRHYLSDKVEDFRRNVRDKIVRLQSILKKLDWYPIRASVAPVMEHAVNGQTVFISHSSEDGDVISTVKQAFDDLDLKPIFIEKTPQGEPPVASIVELVAKSKALFAFFTSKAITGETRDWIVFELGVAFSKGRKRFAWTEDSLSRTQLPGFIEQVTTHRPFEVRSVNGAHKLQREVKQAARGLL